MNFKMRCKKDIGIITWHYYSNFGSCLQAYALQVTISKLGYSSDFINYRKYKTNIIKEYFKYFLSHFDAIIPYGLKRRFRYSFIAFQKKYFKEGKRYYDAMMMEELNLKYHAFISGSDQIWAPNVFCEPYFLSFVAEDKPKISYASSIGLAKIPDDLKSRYCQYLRRYNNISTRERQGAELIKEVCGIDAIVVLDPTFLLNKSEWLSIAIFKPIKEKYILCYFLGDNGKHREIAKNIAKRRNCKILMLSKNDKDRNFADFTDVTAGPREFLGYIYNSECVCTDSFHGVALSINLNKDFYVFERFSTDDPINQNSRIYNILQLMNLMNRLTRTEDFLNIPINYDEVVEILNKERAKSLKYLSNSLNHAMSTQS